MNRKTELYQLKLDTPGRSTERLSYEPTPGAELTILLPCNQPEHLDSSPVGVLTITPKLALDLLAKMDAVKATPGERPAYVVFWGYDVRFVDLLCTDHEDAEDVRDEVQSALWDGDIVVPTPEQLSMFDFDAGDIRTECEKLVLSPALTDSQGSDDVWWSMGVKHTDFEVESHAIGIDLLRIVANSTP